MTAVHLALTADDDLAGITHLDDALSHLAQTGAGLYQYGEQAVGGLKGDVDPNASGD